MTPDETPKDQQAENAADSAARDLAIQACQSAADATTAALKAGG